MLDWLIIGGGMQGTHLSLYLTTQKGLPPDRVRVLDPHPVPFARWNAFTANIDMAFLRSAGIHHPGLHNTSLYDWVGITAHARDERFSEPYKRPAYTLFQAYCAYLVQTHGLDSLRIQGMAQGLTRLKNGWRVETEQGGIETHNIILSIGRTQLRVPSWAEPLREAGAPVNHIFDAGFVRANLPDWEQAVVIGGGITAGQVAVSMSKQCPERVKLVMRTPIHESYFDSSPCWLAPRCRGMLRRESRYDRRRAMVNEARQSGSMSPDVAREVRAAIKSGQLDCRVDEVHSATWDGQHITLGLLGGGLVQADRLVLATGFNPTRPGGSWLDAAVQTYALPCAPGGYPIVSHQLAWADGLYVSGPLSELELGPAAANIIGARMAADRIGLAVR